MRYTFPHYFDTFRCVAAECTDTCCAGWAIMIDEESLERYANLEGAFGNRVKNSINWKEGSFHQCEKRCVFLNEDNLCDMHMMGGEQMLCDTCRNYPRHMEEYEGLREGSLSLSCIEAAKIILGCQEPVRFITLEDDELDEEYEDFDFLLFTKLMDARDVVLKVLQDRTLDIMSRMGIVLKLSQEIQEAIDKEEYYKIDDLLLELKRDESYMSCLQALKQENMSPNAYYTMFRKLLRSYKHLEVLKEDWPDYLKKAEWSLYSDGQATYEDKRKRFHKDIETDNYEVWSNCMEQLIVYFIYVYFCGAVYDDNLLGIVQSVVVSVLVIRELIFASWVQQGEMLTFDDIVEVAHRYSREVEHSDINLGRLEKILAENEMFSAENILKSLCYDILR